MHLGHVGLRVGRDATVRSTPGLARRRPGAGGGDRPRTPAPAATVELIGLYFADAGQHLEHRLFVDHSAPHCRSNVTYKGALQGERAHTVWIGDVLIRAGAEGTDTYELNRNLVLTDGARADSVPNLEIETGEIVGAGHASATGRFDDEQLFYLQARGIPEAEARRLVVRGFFVELIQQIGVPELRGPAAGRDRGRAGRARALSAGELACAACPTCPRSAPSGWSCDGDRRSPSSATRTATCTRSATPARTRRSRCPRARWRTAPSSAGCTGPASTCAPASPSAAGDPAGPGVPRDRRGRRRPRRRHPHRRAPRTGATKES